MCASNSNGNGLSLTLDIGVADAVDEAPSDSLPISISMSVSCKHVSPFVVHCVDLIFPTICAHCGNGRARWSPLLSSFIRSSQFAE